MRGPSDRTAPAKPSRCTGVTWTTAHVAGAFTRPGFVSATSPRNVWVGGSECGGGPPGPSVTAAYVARYNGHTWTTTRWKTTAYCRAALVTTGPKNGWLLGNNQALHFTGKQWRKVSIANLGQVLAATAVSANDIWTIGGRFNALHLAKSKAFLTHYNGRGWREVALPAIKLPKYGYIYPPDIEAASANSVWAAATVFPMGRSNRLSDRVPLGLAALEWQPLAVDIAAGHTRPTAAGNAGRQRGVWAIMFQSVTGEYKFAHYSGGSWTFDAVPTAGLPAFGSSATFDVYAISRIPGTRSMLGTGDVFYYDAKNVNRQYSLIFRYGP